MVTIPLVAAALFNRLYSLLFKCFYVKMVCVFFFSFYVTILKDMMDLDAYENN